LVAPLGEIRPGETIRGSFDHALAGQKFHNDTRRVAKDGAIIEVSVTASPIKLPDGRTVGVSAFIRDIRSRKRTEEALKQSESFGWAVFESSPDCVKIIDDAGNLVGCTG
jgi:PAS domain-containing protein